MHKRMMHRGILTISASILLVAAGSVAANAEDTSGHHKRIARHHNVQPPGHGITSFSSSSVLHVGVNHPPKNR
jgi:hypothetical protein